MSASDWFLIQPENNYPCSCGRAQIFLDYFQQHDVLRVPRSVGFDMATNGFAEQIKIADYVEDFVPDKLIGIA